MIGNALFFPAFLLDISSFLILSAYSTTSSSLVLANSNTAFIVKGNNVFLWIFGHIVGLFPRMQNLLQLVEAVATGDRCTIDTIDMTYTLLSNLVILLDYIFIIIFVTLDFTIYMLLQTSMHCRNESYYKGNYSYSVSPYKL